MKDKIIEITEDLKQGTITEHKAQNLLLGLFGVTNCYYVKDSEYKKIQELKSNTIKLKSGSGIGICVSCLNKKGKWIDVTDYNSW